ncbi:hypothetical protein BDN72DRAFT_766469 [Pluteus cervinus]|uniref:Uncharacterized protein n=1 Tax=Pluteus cervinus TaxID=181527 RepID=A0ACD3AY44_9AGAR|nr:hypothetical protein BDN72DRAFT_766469 [Pluteus cervinus]
MDETATATSNSNEIDAPTSRKIYKGGCFCGNVTYQVIGPPILSAYCHCTLCQRVNASPFILSVHFPAASFSWSHAAPHESNMDPYAIHHKPWKVRWRCKNCGSVVASNNTKLDKWSIWGAQLERDSAGRIIGWDEVKPTAHIFYDTRLVDVADDLGKWTGYENESERIG